MRPSFSLSSELYAQVLEQLGNLHFTETLGYDADLNFFRNDLWLCETAVIQKVTSRKGTWEIALLFAHHLTPLCFLSRRITHHTCSKRAGLIADLMRRLAAKDQRGTLRIDLSRFFMPPN